MILHPRRLSPPRRALTEHFEIIAYLENRFGCQLFISGNNFAQNGSGSLKFRISVSNSKRYSDINQWFVKIPEIELIESDWMVIWGGWTSDGWLIPSKELLAYLIAIKKSKGERWDPRFGIVDDEGIVWTDATETGQQPPYPISEYYVDFHSIRAADFPALEAPSFMGLAAPETAGTTDQEISGITETTAHLRKRAERDQANRELGFLGECFIVAQERYRLSQMGRADLAKKVEHVSEMENSDRLGFDVLSYSPDERPIHIEVKTTRGNSKTPFYISDNELKFAGKNKETWQLARIFNFGPAPSVRRLLYPIDAAATLRPVSYLAKFRAV